MSAVNQALVTLAYFGVSINLVLFLTRVLKKENAIALNQVSIWTGIVYLFSFFAAFISDSYLGRFRTFFISQLILIPVCFLILSLLINYFLFNCFYHFELIYKVVVLLGFDITFNNVMEINVETKRLW